MRRIARLLLEDGCCWIRMYCYAIVDCITLYYVILYHVILEWCYIDIILYYMILQ